MTKVEQQHMKRVLRVLDKASRELAKLNRHARFADVWPKTTEKAYVEILQARNHAEIRFAAHNAQAI